MTAAQSGVTPEANTNALFLVLNIDRARNHLGKIRTAIASIPAVTKQLSEQYPDAHLSSTISIGYQAWNVLYPSEHPKLLQPFVAIKDGDREAPATPGDLLLHIRSNRHDINFLLMQSSLHNFGSTVEVEEEVNGFRYLNSRDLTGFIDGTENPEGSNRLDVALVGSEDRPFTGGSYIHCQRYVHHLNKWAKHSTPEQEKIIGRTKSDNIEFSSEQKAPTAHIKRVNLKDKHGQSMEILRHSMPYGSSSEAGLFFIAYSKTPEHFNLMLKSMITTDSEGHYDHLMDFSTPVTGCAFFAPSLEFLQNNH